MPDRAPPSCAFGCLLDAHSSMLRLVTDLVAEADALCLALACRALRDAVLAKYRPHTPEGTAALRTVDAAVVATASRLAWARGLPAGQRPGWLGEWPSDEVCHRCAAAGALPTLRYARQQGCPWLPWQVLSKAASHGHLHVIKWARAHGCGRTIANPLICAAAAGGGHLEVLRWLRESGDEWGPTTCSAAASPAPPFPPPCPCCACSRPR